MTQFARDIMALLSVGGFVTTVCAYAHLIG
jgi:hypothetical protein